MGPVGSLVKTILLRVIFLNARNKIKQDFKGNYIDKYL